MTTYPFARALGAALLGAALSVPALPALAGIKDYAFVLIRTEAKVGETILSVRLMDKRTGKPVPDAVIFAKRIDMAPDGMREMQSKLEPMPGGEPGIYQFKTNLDMTGRWGLTLGAKVQGETETVQSKLIVNAK